MAMASRGINQTKKWFVRDNGLMMHISSHEIDFHIFRRSQNGVKPTTTFFYSISHPYLLRTLSLHNYPFLSLDLHHNCLILFCTLSLSWV